ncbi:hypothetical protein PRIPAC_77368 [Pristionchus pacificus]|uniref:G protein-coupled receptor n=1 Tax=Pristionchus pacificus TaxID=54126 RepID=A0A2A6C2Q5_PRIPA|nr:hypothetical protein PRIPAC_77368 [Pristionchus pacificus]|eukprot:PDM72420.1 G protein-coupled receptor [Pristionchus pacificus]
MVDVLSWILYFIAAPFLILLALVATVLNATIIASRFYVKSRSSTLEMTYSLAVTDTLSSIAQAASLFWNSFGPMALGMKHDSWCFSMALEVFRMGFMLTGVFHIAALAFLHYLRIARPFDHARIISLRKTHVLMIILWIVPTLSMAIYFWSFPGAGFQATNCNAGPTGMYFYYNIYFRSLISIVIVTMMVATCIIYLRLLKIVDSIRQKAVGIPKRDHKISDTSEKSDKSGKSLTSGDQNNFNRGHRTVVTATIIYGTFLFGWTPACCLFILTAEGMPLHDAKQSWFGVVFFISMLCMILKTITNPIIYATRIPEVRKFVRRYWKSSLKRKDITDQFTSSRRKSEDDLMKNNACIVMLQSGKILVFDSPSSLIPAVK